MGEPSFWDNQDKAQETINRLKPLNGMIKPFEELRSSIGDLEALAELCDEDESLEADLETDLDKVETAFSAFELKAMLSGKQDASNCYLRIQAGAGGTDACDWAEMLLRMYSRWAEDHGYTVAVTDRVDNIEAGIQSATMHVSGEYAYGYLQGETGVHRLIRMSPFGSGDTRQTSFAAVDVTPELDNTIVIDIKPEDLRRDVFRCGGPGGQHQNKTESGVRYTHIPTGVAQESRSERSQHKNNDLALAMLKAKLYAIEEAKQRSEFESAYDAKGDVSFGHQIRNYTLQPFTLCKDVRLGVETAQVAKVLDGDLDMFIHAYLRHKTERMNKKPAATPAKKK